MNDQRMTLLEELKARFKGVENDYVESKERVEILEKHGQDLRKAIQALEPDDEQPETPPSQPLEAEPASQILREHVPLDAEVIQDATGTDFAIVAGEPHEIVSSAPEDTGEAYDASHEAEEFVTYTGNETITLEPSKPTLDLGDPSEPCAQTDPEPLLASWADVQSHVAAKIVEAHDDEVSQATKLHDDKLAERWAKMNGYPSAKVELKDEDLQNCPPDIGGFQNAVEPTSEAGGAHFGAEQHKRRFHIFGGAK